MNVTMIGTGYVGLVSGTCFADIGNVVTCLDIDEAKIAGLERGEIPIYEPGLEEMVVRNAKLGRLKFSTSYEEAVPGADVVFIGVGTPQSDDGSADLRGIWAVVDTLAKVLDERTVVVIKSTVPVGTNRKAAARFRELTGRDVRVASNPEFLKEGAAIEDCTEPDRVVVGTPSADVADLILELHKPFLRTEKPFLHMNWESAEMTKYVANCMLATKISFINEVANLCERVGADVNEVRRGIGHDRRIGFQFLFPGVGYGGSCFPKDVNALIRVAVDHGVEPRLLNAVDAVNDAQKSVLFAKLDKHFGGEFAGRTVAVWGLAFKPRTDDIREAPALVLLDALLSSGATVKAHDPVATANVRDDLASHPAAGNLSFVDHHYEAAEGADALAICTEWSDYQHPDFDYLMHILKTPAVFDGRNLYDPVKMRDRGFAYHGIGLDYGE